MKKIIISINCIIILMLITAVVATAQTNNASDPALNSTSQNFKGHIIGKGKPYTDRIALRWNIDTYQLFNNLVMGGVVIDRLIIGKDNKAEVGGWKRITTDTVKALSLKAFNTPDIKSDTAKMIVAQSLYGKSQFPQGLSLFAKIKMQSEEKQNKQLIVSLYSALSPAAAMAAGLAYEDKIVPDSNKKYVYRISPAKQLPGLGKIDTGYVYVIGHDVAVKEVYEGLKAQGKDQQVMLKWPMKTSPFTGYFIERSADGQRFKRVNQHVYLPQADTSGGDINYVYYDSVANYKKYHYRLIGVNAFGEKHTFKEVAIGMGVDQTAPKSPALKFTRQKSNVSFSWTGSPDKDLKGYYVLRGRGINQMDTLAGKEMLKPGVNKYQYTLPKNFTSGFFRVMAADTSGNISFSNAVYIFEPDSVPPAAPVGIAGSINKKGMVNLNWQGDRTGDVLRGYKVFMSNSPDVVFSSASEIVADTTYAFHTSLQTTTKSLYVKLVAVDANFNNSKFSSVIKLSRPDTIGPPKPVLLGYTNTNKGISINWAKDQSTDLSHYILFRRVAGDTAWVNIKQTRAINHTDSTVTGGLAYEYSLRAIDSTGLASPYAFPLYIKTAAVLKAFDIGLSSSFDPGKKLVTVKWNKPADQVKFYLLYKDQGRGLSMYKSIPATEQTFTEDGVAQVNQRYAIKVVYANNAESDIYILK